MGRRRNRGRRRGRGQRSNFSRYLEWYHGTLTPGAVAIVQRNHLELNFDRAFKWIAVHYEVASSGGPTFCNVRGYGPVGNTGAISETGVFLVGGLPRKGTLRVTAPWFPKDTAGTATICTVDHICRFAADDSVRLLITLRMELLLSPEEVTAQCPKLLMVRDSAPMQESDRAESEGSASSAWHAVGM